jgi:hypothetical protein
MLRRVRNLISLTIVLLFAIILPSFTLKAELKTQSFLETVIPSSTPVKKSIFKNDTCSPPCWFDLIPGKSSSADVVEVLLQNQDKFFVGKLQDFGSQPNEATLEPFTDGFYSFYWTKWTKNRMPINSVLVIKDDRLSWMSIMLPEIVPTITALAEFGQPNEIRLTVGVYDFSLALSYNNLHIVVFVSAPNDQCSMSNILNDYILDSITYYDPKHLEQFESDWLLDKWAVLPQETWKKWTDGKVKGLCADAISEALTRIDATATQAAGATRTAAATQTAAPTFPTQSPIPTTTPNSK